MAQRMGLAQSNVGPRCGAEGVTQSEARWPDDNKRGPRGPVGLPVPGAPAPEESKRTNWDANRVRTRLGGCCILRRSGSCRCNCRSGYCGRSRPCIGISAVVLSSSLLYPVGLLHPVWLRLLARPIPSLPHAPASTPLATQSCRRQPGLHVKNRHAQNRHVQNRHHHVQNRHHLDRARRRIRRVMPRSSLPSLGRPAATVTAIAVSLFPSFHTGC
jgi:hypothetical protein